MVGLEFDFEKLLTDLKKLKILLFLLTIVEMVYFFILFTDNNLWTKIDYEYNANWIVLIFHCLVVVVFIFYIWREYPFEGKKKVNDIIMILFLGLIGMWLWLPNFKDLNKSNEKHNKQKFKK